MKKPIKSERKVMFQRIGSQLYAFMESNGRVYWNRVDDSTFLFLSEYALSPTSHLQLVQDKSNSKTEPNPKPWTKQKAA